MFVVHLMHREPIHANIIDAAIIVVSNLIPAEAARRDHATCKGHRIMLQSETWEDAGSAKPAE
jgi:hypothetical protein